ncbi:hypothetical protein [Streptomyces nigra]|uniref:hypothetical protein n=1 Tax=Streptomyces nigra TaxID=1827580 RepID=UPI00342BDF34
MAGGWLAGSGRTADVYEVDRQRVLRRDREGYGDGSAEGWRTATDTATRLPGCVSPVLAEAAHAALAALPADPSDLTGAGPAQALRDRAANPAMTERETGGLVGAADHLIRTFLPGRPPPHTAA